jgi:hypothetical protein
MRTKSLLLLGLSLVVLGCGRYYLDTNLNSMSVGLTKDAFLQTYGGTCSGRVNACKPAIVRAAQRQSDGSLLEVLTLEMINTSGSVSTDYWFVFRDSRLVQWGRPEDWQQVSGKYEISFNPGPSVRR